MPGGGAVNLKIREMGAAVRNKYLGDVVDDGAETGETGRHDSLVVEDDQLDAGLLQLAEEDLAGMLY